MVESISSIGMVESISPIGMVESVSSINMVESRSFGNKSWILAKPWVKFDFSPLQYTTNILLFRDQEIGQLEQYWKLLEAVDFAMNDNFGG